MVLFFIQISFNNETKSITPALSSPLVLSLVTQMVLSAEAFKKISLLDLCHKLYTNGTGAICGVQIIENMTFGKFTATHRSTK